jgi:hypothetical protein
LLQQQALVSATGSLAGRRPVRVKTINRALAVAGNKSVRAAMAPPSRSLKRDETGDFLQGHDREWPPFGRKY